MIAARPRLIARCGDVADVIAAVNFGREQKLQLSVWAKRATAPSTSCASRADLSRTRRQKRPSISSVPYLIRRCRACSIRSIRQACNGTGRPISCAGELPVVQSTRFELIINRAILEVEAEIAVGSLAQALAFGRVGGLHHNDDRRDIHAIRRA
jgi:hypothetical protein